ncbi:hypothetical protein ACVWW6_004216 [Bradyrhizobium sp. USDA 3311]
MPCCSLRLGWQRQESASCPLALAKHGAFRSNKSGSSTSRRADDKAEVGSGAQRSGSASQGSRQPKRTLCAPLMPDASVIRASNDQAKQSKRGRDDAGGQLRRARHDVLERTKRGLRCARPPFRLDESKKERLRRDALLPPRYGVTTSIVQKALCYCTFNLPHTSRGVRVSTIERSCSTRDRVEQQHLNADG